MAKMQRVRHPMVPVRFENRRGKRLAYSRKHAYLLSIE